MISRVGKEEGKCNCFDTLPQLAAAHHAMLSPTIFFFPSAYPAKFSPTFLLLFSVFSCLPSSPFLVLNSPLCFLKHAWQWPKTKITVSSSSQLISTHAEIPFDGKQFTVNVCTLKSIHNTACFSFWSLVLRYTVRVAFYTSAVECSPFL